MIMFCSLVYANVWMLPTC